jgi:D-alanyl-D-alanine dipeptidase
MLIHANQMIINWTDGQMQLCIEDIYRPIEVQRIVWHYDYIKQLKITNGDAAKAEEMTKILVSDPRGFDELNPHTWPIHTTGAAVDVGLWSQNGEDEARIIIDEYFDNAAHDCTDCFEKKIAAGEKLSEREQICLLNRRLLFVAMTEAGFENYPREAWHYDYKDQMWAMMRRIKGDTNTIAEYGYMRNPEK